MYMRYRGGGIGHIPLKVEDPPADSESDSTTDEGTVDVAPSLDNESAGIQTDLELLGYQATARAPTEDTEQITNADQTADTEERASDESASESSDSGSDGDEEIGSEEEEEILEAEVTLGFAPL
ncbi:hypothetical protein K474DRAFT_1674481 [Panus rudis PR-1116 ss-1]|nr:hypothetical protein K474DRAFT_1674481 [Panus rudis PR-1116 ss-1]